MEQPKRKWYQGWSSTKQNVILTIILAAIVVVVATGGFISQSNVDRMETAKRFTYTGTVTSVVISNPQMPKSTVYLDGGLQSLKIAGTVSLQIGQNYQLVVDGQEDLISAVIVGK